MKKVGTVLTLLLCVVFAAFLNAQDRFDRSAVIPADSLDIGGFGNVIAGVDFDGDGKVEIYTVNNDWHDQLGFDLTPRMYKYEQNDDGMWEVVWWTALPFDFQNTWPAFTYGDMDQDGKEEIAWGPVNNFGGGLNPNPERIVVFETPGDGSDNMGVDNGDGTWRPNAQWTIVDDDNHNLRPFRWQIHDIDSDGHDEIVACARVGDGIQIYSVDDVPDAADSTETWTQEFSGVTGTFYDMAIIDSTVYGIQSNGSVTAVTWSASGDSFRVAPKQVGIVGAGSWKSAQTVDVDGNLQEEIIVASWSSSTSNVYLLQQSGDTLTSTVIKDVPDASNRLYGGAAGDLDSDGLLDFVFGTRSATPNATIHRLEYQGGAIDDPANWDLSSIDHGISNAAQYDVIFTANMDDDSDDEVLYTGIPRGLSSSQPPQPLVILDRVPPNQPIIVGVRDVPNDQGRQVWVVWEGSADDAAVLGKTAFDSGTIPVAVSGPVNDFPVMTYKGKTLKPMAAAKNGSGNQLNETITQYVVWRLEGDPRVPVQVATVVPIQAGFYAAVVPTLGDGEDWAGTFVVSAHTPDVSVFWKSIPKSGESEDNLVPTIPTNLTATVEDGTVSLTWDESPDEDFNYFTVFRNSQSGFEPTDADIIGNSTSPDFADSDVQSGESWFYRVVAVDFNGNVGELSEETGAIITGISDRPDALPKEFALHQNYPNPFNPETTIKFDLPQAVDVEITIYNTLGQKVRTLLNESSKPAGTYAVRWNSLNDGGVRVSSGVYIYLIKAGEFTHSRKMILLK